MNSIIEAKKQRYVRFYDMASDEKRLFHIHIANDPKVKPPPALWRENKQQRIDAAISAYEAAMARLDWLQDDFIPFTTCLTGTEIFAEAMGSRVIKPKDTNPFALPFVTEAAQVSKIQVPRLEDSSLFWLFDMADQLKAACGKDALLSLPDVQTPMDIAALIWDKTTFFIAVLEEQEAVRELTHKISQLYFAFFDEWFRRYGSEFIAHYPDYYMPSGLTFSEDEIGAVSPAVFEEMFLPELVSIAERYGSVGMHSCADSRHQWAGFKKIPNLKLLNLARPADVMVASSAYFATHTAMLPSWSGTGAPETWFDQLDPRAHICLELTVQNDEEAKALADKLNRAR